MYDNQYNQCNPSGFVSLCVSMCVSACVCFTSYNKVHEQNKVHIQFYFE